MKISAAYTYQTYSDPASNRALIVKIWNGRSRMMVSNLVSTDDPTKLDHIGREFHRDGVAAFLRTIRLRWDRVRSWQADE